MEDIVSKNRTLIWDGWDVLSLKYHPMAWTKPNAIQIKNKWFYVQRYEPTENGWEIPAKLVR